MKRPIVIILLLAALAFVCVGIAAVLFFAVNSSFPANNPFDVRNVPSSVEENKTLKVDIKKPLALKVLDDSGAVTVKGGAVETVQVKAVKTAYDSSQARADQEVKGIKYTIEQNGNAITLKYELPKSMNVRNKVNTVDFIVTVPTETTVDVKTSSGEVNVSGTKGNVNIANSFGDVTVQNVEGLLTVDTSSGEVHASSIKANGENIHLTSGFGKVTLEKASGEDIQLHSSSGILKMTDVRASGDIEMSTDFGDIDFTNGSANQLDVNTNSGKVTLDTLQLQDVLTAKSDFGEIDVEKVKATSYDLQTDSGSITADGVFGKVKAHSGYGSIKVRNADTVTLSLDTQSGSVEFEGSLGKGPHTVSSDFGDITMTIPGDAALNVDLKTDFGSITSDLPITVILSGEIGKNHQTGTINDGGDLLKVETQSGNISIQATKKESK